MSGFSPPRVGMVGAGQLARMTQQAAVDLGVRLNVLAGGPEEPAVLAGAEASFGSPDDAGALRSLARTNQVVTFDHEGVPPELLEELEGEGVSFAPPPAAKLMAQDKAVARTRLAELGFPVPPNASVDTLEGFHEFAELHGWPVVAKAPRGGYDGRGVWMVEGPDQARTLIQEAEGPLLLETMLELDREIAVLAARTTGGEVAVYPAIETVQRDAMCRELLVPAPVSGELAAEATGMGVAIAEAIGATGLVAVELFSTSGGLLVNELALRPHNSGHFSIEGAETSQFEQHLRAVLDWPLGSTELTAPAVATVNVVGPADGSDPRERLTAALAVDGAHIHIYDKDSRPGRKLGHVTARADTVEKARQTALNAAAILEGGPS